MRGNELLMIGERHRIDGERTAARLLPRLVGLNRLATLSVAGEAGAGKSETAHTAAEALRRAGYSTLVLSQEDYFRLPPNANAAKRRSDISWVGLGEVDLERLDADLAAARTGAKVLRKPRVDVAADRIAEESLDLEGIKVLIAEGTYTTLLEHVDLRVFLPATYHRILERRLQGRDEIEGAFIERVLELEHCIVREHRLQADLVL